MKQVIRRGLKEIIVDEVADPVVTRNSVLVRPFYSLISTGNGNRRHSHRQHRQRSCRQSFAFADGLERDEKNRSGRDF